MEYHPETKHKVKPRVPLVLRSLVYSVVNTKGLEELGKGYYEWASNIIARSFLKFHDVSEVYLIGGGLDRCVPAVSDLDFLVVIEPQFENEFLHQFQRNLRTLTFRFPVLGEVHLVRKDKIEKFSNSSNAALNWFHRCHRFENRSWKRNVFSGNNHIKDESKLSLSLFHFWKAHLFLIQSLNGHKAYFERHFQREVSKCIDYLNSSTLSIRRGQSNEVLILTALKELENKAIELLERKEKDLDLILDLKDRGGERFAIEVKQRQFYSKLKGPDSLRKHIKKTTVPGVFEFQGHGNVSNDVIRSYYRCVARQKDPPILVGKNALQLIKYGLGWGLPFAHFDWISPFERGEEEFRIKLKTFTLFSIKERLRLNATLFRGKIVSLNTEKIYIQFFEVFYCYYALKNNLLTNDLEKVEDELKHLFPNLPSKQKKDYLQALQTIEKEMAELL